MTIKDLKEWMEECDVNDDTDIATYVKNDNGDMELLVFETPVLENDKIILV